MAAMYANNLTSGMGKLDQPAEFTLNSKGLLFPEDERSTDASGSEPVTSGSEDESITPKQSPELKFAQPKNLPGDAANRADQDKKTSDWSWLWAALRCERRATPMTSVPARRSTCATATKARVPPFSQTIRCPPGDGNSAWKAARPQKRLPPPAESIQRAVVAAKPAPKPTPVEKPSPPVERQREVLAQLFHNQCAPPPGLEPVAPTPVCRPPPGLENEIRLPPGLTLEPANSSPDKPTAPTQPRYFPTTAFEVVPYSRKAFRKEMSSIFSDIRQARTASLQSAVHRVRAQNVPKEEQASIFSELMTRAVEEMSGPGRRLCMAFVTGIAAGSPSAFDKSACIAGIKIFFADVYDDLQNEVPKLSTRVEREFLPSLRPIFDARELNEALPARLRVAP